MKKVIYVATLLVAAVCMAEEKKAEGAKRPDHPQGQRGHFLSKEMIAKFDKDGDGKLNEEETKAAREAAMLKRFDKDGDGKLNDEEKTAADAFKKEADARQAEMIKKFDKDGDGKLSDDEKKAAREAFMKSHGEGKGGHEGKSDKPKEEKK
jgi:Ca2+-binding EF-hand superfamily protein